jgi:hypothetical protein
MISVCIASKNDRLLNELQLFVGFSIDRLGAFIKRHVKLAYLIEETSTELVYQLPDDDAELRKFESLFTDLEKNHKSLGISSFGISDTSLEEAR